MALTDNTPLTCIRGEQSQLPAAAVKIYEGAILGDNALGYARGLVAGDPFRGHSVEYIDNTLGSAGDQAVTCLTGQYRLEVTLSGVAITDVGRDVYASADDTYTLVANGNSRVGKVARYVTTSTAIVEFNTVGAKSILAYSQVAASSALTNTVTETTLASVTLDGKRLRAGDVIRVRAQGIATATNSTDTLTLKLYAATEVVYATAALDVANSDVWLIDMDIVVRIAGASGHLAGAGQAAFGAAATTLKSIILADAAEDVSGDVVVKITGTWSVASSSNSCRNDVFNVTVLPAAAA